MEENLEKSLEEMEKEASDYWNDEALCNYSDDEAGEVFDGYDY